MNDFKFSNRSLKALDGVHPSLQLVAALALCISPIDFVVVEGKRSKKRQKYLFETGRSQTLESAHLWGCAIDCYPIVNGQIELEHIPAFVQMADAFADAAQALYVSLRWGGDWDRDGDWRDERFLDGPHFELDPHSWNWTDPHPAPLTLAELGADGSTITFQRSGDDPIIEVTPTKLAKLLQLSDTQLPDPMEAPAPVAIEAEPKPKKRRRRSRGGRR